MNGERFFYMLPKLVTDITAIRDLLMAEDIELTKAEEVLDKLVRNSYLHSIVDEETVAIYERIFGIKTFGDLETRRSMLIAKLRGAGATTKELVKNVAESFTYGEVAVIQEYEQYTVRIKFISEKGVPKNLEALRHSLREIIPAHLDIRFEFTYTTWGEHLAKTWNDLFRSTWNEARVV